MGTVIGAAIVIWTSLWIDRYLEDTGTYQNLAKTGIAALPLKKVLRAALLDFLTNTH
jgi:hypothetical protein